MSANVSYLFVYGSLRKGFNNPMFTYITQYFNFVDDATVKGMLVALPNIPVAVPLQNNTDNFTIKGELYEIKNPLEFDWAIAQLDDYEGVTQIEDEDPPHYARSVVDATTQAGKTYPAWMYWYTEPVSAGKIIESGDVYDFKPTA